MKMPTTRKRQKELSSKNQENNDGSLPKDQEGTLHEMKKAWKDNLEDDKVDLDAEEEAGSDVENEVGSDEEQEEVDSDEEEQEEVDSDEEEQEEAEDLASKLSLLCFSVQNEIMKG